MPSEGIVPLCRPPQPWSPVLTSALALPPPAVMSKVPSRMVSVQEASMPSPSAVMVKLPSSM